MNTAANSMEDNQSQQATELAYHLLRASIERFSKSVHELDESQYDEARNQAQKTYALESLVLSTPEARGVIIPDEEVAEAEASIAARYETREEFLADLSANDIDEANLHHALHRELLFNAVMERVASHSPQINEVDINIFYEMHRDKFTIPEKRTARHILITVNSEYAENTRETALSRINSLAEELQRKPGRFAKFARQNSECPTAVQDGLLGEIKRGTLYPELDAVLFSLKEGGISDAVESEIGFHIIYCEKISPQKVIPRENAEKRIRALLEERARRACQKSWIEPLLANLN